jgi:hypothetical protein
MLYPAGFGINLLVFFLVDRDDFPAVIEQDTACAGGSLVDGRDVFLHDTLQ